MGTFPDRSSATRLIGAMLAEQHAEWVKQRRYMGQELLFRVAPAKAGQDENKGVMLPMAAVAQPSPRILRWRCVHHLRGRELTDPLHTRAVAGSSPGPPIAISSRALRSRNRGASSATSTTSSARQAARHLGGDAAPSTLGPLSAAPHLTRAGSGAPCARPACWRTRESPGMAASRWNPMLVRPHPEEGIGATARRASGRVTLPLI